MGYYTDYEMSLCIYRRDGSWISFESLSANIHKDIQKFIEDTKVDGWSYLSDVWAGEGGGLTWYDHQKDMVRLSTAFPDVLFTLYGDGEEADDHWKEYYFHGKCQVAKGEIVYPDFDEKKLEAINFNICPACLGSGVLDADGFPTTGCRICWGTGEITN